MTDEAGFMAAPESEGPYRVLARKYRPKTFSELIGQDAMVKTLANAIASGRLAHAFILTGVRGVGKTSTARLIARALNCIGPDGQGGPTVDPCGVCPQCVAIAESRHVDVLEMDAASRTGVDDIREIIEGVRYSPVSARFKIYIIDEVHMLTRNAFNALLKTLEEPPEHVKFLFATTEIRKVPVTVLSRCQRFDLRRVEAQTLTNHFRAICGKEGANVDDKALALISRAAEGSVRDGLSLLDQAIAHGAGQVSEDMVRDMLGLADRAQILDLYRAIMAGAVDSALGNLRTQYNLGVDPVVILQDLLELTHWITRLKVVPDAGEDSITSESERLIGGELARDLSIPILTRAWQMLIKGLEETRISPSPIAAAEMVVIRLCYVADLPNPGDLVKKLTQGGFSGGAAGNGGGGGGYVPSGGGAARAQNLAINVQAAPDSVPMASAGPRSFAEVVALLENNKEGTLAHHLTVNVHLVKFTPGLLDIRLRPECASDVPNKLSAKLRELTGRPWIITISQESGDQSLKEKDVAHKAKLRSEAEANPLVREILTAFPGADITDIRVRTDNDEHDLDSLILPDGSDDDMFGLDD
ncbi:DNA polymerase III subunit gamma/tau [Govanella unica]|uniref:DNA polymerase III subunit gamma/tau n=1 Tax=Govanella unica TaxID=2975056 RepID=A0A9X3TWG1_9PROT|nr:DNA polymerase III subunit gamma/tau [Govania unica]MDA5192957.1 DNA polymerase III subunit gamma/tau [Govania unica]